jgi:hypothetical protein
MSAEAIANFDMYAWVAVGLFITGLFAVMVYEKSSSESKRNRQQQSGTAANNTEKQRNRAADY